MSNPTDTPLQMIGPTPEGLIGIKKGEQSLVLTANEWWVVMSALTKTCITAPLVPDTK